MKGDDQYTVAMTCGGKTFEVGGAVVANEDVGYLRGSVISRMPLAHVYFMRRFCELWLEAMKGPNE